MACVGVCAIGGLFATVFSSECVTQEARPSGLDCSEAWGTPTTIST